MLATASHYLMLVSMEAITVLECQLTPVLVKKIVEGEMNIPPPRHLGCLLNPLPYYLVGDEIFSLKTWLRPYPGQPSEEERILHYRLSCAR